MEGFHSRFSRNVVRVRSKHLLDFARRKHREMLNRFCRNYVDFVRLPRRCFSICGEAAVDIAAKDGELRVFIVAGEVSGDNIGSRLMISLSKLSPFPVRFSGVGGVMMTKQGLSSIFPMEDIAVMGIWELLPHLNKFRVKLRQTVEAAVLFKPHVVVTVDSKGFSFRLLKNLSARYCQLGQLRPIHFHYVAPSFWAWKGGESRLKGLTGFVDHILCILPFEERVLQQNGIMATFVGHPVLEDALYMNSGNDTDTVENKWKVQGDGDKFRSKYGINPGSTIITLLPGSRLQEVNRMIPIFINTVKLLKDSFSDLTTIVHVAPNQHVQDYISTTVNKWPVPVILIPGGSPSIKYDAFSASRVALCTSGTVAMELQLARLPCVVAYRAHFLTELYIRYKADVSYISLPNILLDSPIIPEALFQDCTPSKLALMLMGLIDDERLEKKQTAAAEKVIKLLSPSNLIPSMIAASTILYTTRTGR